MDEVIALTQALAQARCSESHLLAQYAVTLVLAESATLKEATPAILRGIGESSELTIDQCFGAWMSKRRCCVLLTYGIALRRRVRTFERTMLQSFSDLS